MVERRVCANINKQTRKTLLLFTKLFFCEIHMFNRGEEFILYIRYILIVREKLLFFFFERTAIYQTICATI